MLVKTLRDSFGWLEKDKKKERNHKRVTHFIITQNYPEEEEVEDVGWKKEDK